MTAFRRNGPPGKSGGPKRFGGGDFKRRGPVGRTGGGGGGYAPRDFGGRPELHEATCAGCGKRCQVPFRPTGSKPIYCKDCFQSEGRPKQDSFGGGGFRKPAFGPKRAYDAGPKDSGAVEKRLDEMDAKLDRIIRELEAMKGSASEA